MKRFSHEKSYNWIKHILSIMLFFVLLFTFTAGLSDVSDQTANQRARNLELSISRGIAHCYATKGYYPESLEYLKKHYSISYDTEEFFVDYQVLGENIFPDVTIIKK